MAFGVNEGLSIVIFSICLVAIGADVVLTPWQQVSLYQSIPTFERRSASVRRCVGVDGGSRSNKADVVQVRLRIANFNGFYNFCRCCGWDCDCSWLALLWLVLEVTELLVGRSVSQSVRLFSVAALDSWIFAFPGELLLLSMLWYWTTLDKAIVASDCLWVWLFVVG